MIRVLCGTILVAVLVLSVPASSFADDVAGKYNCAGKWVTGKEYSGTVTVTKRGESYELSWKLGADEFTGVGILDGDIFAAEYSGPNLAGVMLLKKSKDGWSGKWIRVEGKGLLHSETWTKAK